MPPSSAVDKPWNGGWRVSSTVTEPSGWEVVRAGGVDADEWNRLVRESGSGSIEHTTMWADRLCELLECDPYYFTAYSTDTGEPAALLLGFDVRSAAARGEPFSPIRWARERARRLTGRARRFAWYGVPVTLAPEARGGAVEALLEEVARLCRETGIGSVGESPVQAGTRLPAGWRGRPWATFLVDLTPSEEEELWAGLKGSGRKAVRRARSDGVTVERVDSLDGLRDYYAFIERCAEEQGRRTLGFRDFETMWRHFRGPAIFETFAARHHGEPVTGLSVWGYGSRIAEIGSFTSERANAERLYGGDLIKWEIMRWGHAAGLETFDLSGFNPEPADSKERGIRQFKEKWGGQRVDYLYASWNLRNAAEPDE